MTLQQLEYILAVARHGHFGRAADACNVTQPTLSAMIGKLEEEIGAKLFDRNRQPIVPTIVGERVINRAREVLDQADTIKDIVLEEKQSLGGMFRIGILPTIAPYLLPRFFPQMMKKYPMLDIRVREMKTHEIKEALIQGDIEAGILANIEGLEDYEQTVLFYEKYIGYVARTDALFKKEVIRTSDVAASRELWLLDEGHCFRDQMVRFCQMKSSQTSQLAYNLGSMETFMRMVESGMGITFIPELAEMQLSDQQRELVRPFAIPVPTRQLLLITRRDFIRQTLLDVIVKEIQASIPKEMLKLKAGQSLV
ncbi:MAG: hydrogen peroxide-inducible genes activator [Bacteroides sp.]|nr:hydrogen peroxide-inducible genes activator [Bacteroides sp.]MBQ8265786.1 hydrogen peroxide-inducible genes activator [Bacteroides sp.]